MWWKKFVQESPYNVGLDAAILMNAQVWVASGHVVNFNDPLIDCKSCKMRHRATSSSRAGAPERRAGRGREMDNDKMGGLHTGKGHRLPGCGKSDFTASQIQPYVQDPSGRHRGQRRGGLSPARDRPGHLCEF